MTTERDSLEVCGEVLGLSALEVRELEESGRLDRRLLVEQLLELRSLGARLAELAATVQGVQRSSDVDPQISALLRAIGKLMGDREWTITKLLAEAELEINGAEGTALRRRLDALDVPLAGDKNASRKLGALLRGLHGRGCGREGLRLELVGEDRRGAGIWRVVQ